MSMCPMALLLHHEADYGLPTAQRELRNAYAFHFTCDLLFFDQSNAQEYVYIPPK